MLDNLPETLGGGLDEVVLFCSVTALLGPDPNTQSAKEKRERLIASARHCASCRNDDVSEPDALAMDTDMEFALSMLWQRIVRLSLRTISKEDSFLLLGGDSISAVKLIAAALSYGIILTTTVVLRDARLALIANATVIADNGQ